MRACGPTMVTFFLSCFVPSEAGCGPTWVTNRVTKSTEGKKMNQTKMDHVQKSLRGMFGSALFLLV